jgi:hypothetical protein
VTYQTNCVDRLNATNIRVVGAGEFNEDGAVCYDSEYKVVIGQGDPPIQSNFLSPADPNNSWWMATSVPAVKAQPWSFNYRDGFCGVRVLDENLDELDFNLELNFAPTDRSTCSNIADNVLHDSQADKLIGKQRIVASRRAKYMALSELTDDLMDTTGALQSFEGELDSGDLIGMIIEMGQFGFGAGETIQSTFREPIRSEYETAQDYETRFYQYIYNYNDRASYSLGCVLDGTCPVNYRDQITDGNI